MGIEGEGQDEIASDGNESAEESGRSDEVDCVRREEIRKV